MWGVVCMGDWVVDGGWFVGVVDGRWAGWKMDRGGGGAGWTVGGGVGVWMCVLIRIYIYHPALFCM